MSRENNPVVAAQGLASVKVLDLTRLLPGPYATQMLLHYGADVIKVEDTAEGDYARDISPLAKSGFGAAFTSANRGKRSIALDLKTASGLQAFLDLVPRADVVVESFRPGVTRRLGIDAGALRAINPRLVYCSISGYGQNTKRAHLAGHDLNFQGSAGLLSHGLWREPAMPTALIGDLVGGSYSAVIAIFAALLERQHTGRGRFIDLSITHSALMLHPILAAHHLAGSDTAAARMRHSGAHPAYRIYETSDGRHVTFAALEAKFWDRFCELAGCPELVGASHSQDHEELKKCSVSLEAIFRARTFDEWSKLSLLWDVCLGPILTAEEAVDESIAEQLPLFARFDAADNEVTVLSGAPADLSQSAASPTAPPPKHGQNDGELVWA